MATQAIPTNSGPSYELMDILAAPNMMGRIQASKSGVPNAFPPEFFAVKPEHKVVGDYGTVTMTTGSRSTSRRSPYGGTHKERSLRNIGQRQYKLIPSYEKIRLPVLTYSQLMNYDNLNRQQMGEQEVYRQVDEFKRIFANTRIAAMASALFWGHINYDELGNLMNPSASVPSGGLSVDIPIPNGTTGIPIPDTNTIGTNISLSNATGLDPFATGTAIFGVPAPSSAGGGSWSNNATHIEQQITNLKIAAIQLTGLELKHCFYGSNIANYVMNNSWLDWYAARNTSKNEAYLGTGEIPPIMDLTWHNASTMFFMDQTNTKQNLVGPNQVLFTPDPMPGTNDSWVGMMEGSSVIPWNVGEIFSDASAATAKMQQMFGMYCYGKQEHDPVTVGVYAGDVMFPAVTNPLAIFSCVVA